MLLKLIMGLAVMLFLWAVQAQAAEIVWQNNILLVQQSTV